MRDLEILVNPAYEPLLDDTARYILMRGGAGSGKSYSVAQKYILKCVGESGVKVLAMRKVGETLRDSVYALLNELIEEYNLHEHVKVNKTEKTFTFSSGSEIICRGIDKPEKIKSITGVTDLWMEEAPEFNLEDWQQLKLRLRGKGKKRQFILSFNPVSELSWVKAEFYDNPKEDSSFYHTTYQDNKFLDDEYVKTLEEMINGDQYYYKVYVLGEWGSLENARILNNLVVHDFDILEGQTIHSGADWGFNDPTVFGAMYVRDQELYIVDEYYKTQRTISERIEEAARFKQYRTIADSSEPGTIKEFQRAGYRMTGAIKGKDSIKHGIDFLRRFKKIHIHKTNCPNAAKELPMYKYKETKDGITDEPLDKNNHWADVCRYATEPLWKGPQKRKVSVKGRVW